MAEKPSISTMVTEAQIRHTEQQFLDGVIGESTFRLQLSGLGVGHAVLDLVYGRLYSMRKHGERYDDRDRYQ